MKSTLGPVQTLESLNRFKKWGVTITLTSRTLLRDVYSETSKTVHLERDTDAEKELTRTQGHERERKSHCFRRLFKILY